MVTATCPSQVEVATIIRTFQFERWQVQKFTDDKWILLFSRTAGGQIVNVT
jgi:hypothetical protein